MAVLACTVNEPPRARAEGWGEMTGPWWIAGECIAALWRLEGRGREYAQHRLQELQQAGIVDRLATASDRLLYERHPELARDLAVACACLIVLQRELECARS